MPNKNSLMTQTTDPGTQLSPIASNEKPKALTPREIVTELDRFIIGQDQAKKAVAIALRNRWRRMQLPADFRREISPKNILMIGPTGVGKTEIARRMAHLANAPFIKVEATKFTEIGYVGKEVDSIIRDLTEIAVKMVRQEEMTRVREKAKELAEDAVLKAIFPLLNMWNKERSTAISAEETPYGLEEVYRTQLRSGLLDDREIEIAVPSPQVEVLMPVSSMDEISLQISHALQNIISQRRSKKRKMTVKEAMKHLEEEESDKLINLEELKSKAVELVEQNGIVFVDEIDKICHTRSDHHSGEVSREGVQRDLLPLIEGCSVTTKHGSVKTDHILFIASGAFQVSRPSDLIPELQGRLPIRVELKALTAEDFRKILTEPNVSLTEQYKALLQCENIRLTFTENGLNRIANIAWQINNQTENIGARRLYTVIEKLMEEASYEAIDFSEKMLEVNEAYVNKQLSEIIKNEDLTRYVL